MTKIRPKHNNEYNDMNKLNYPNSKLRNQDGKKEKSSALCPLKQYTQIDRARM
jgi:hypothetical protein